MKPHFFNIMAVVTLAAVSLNVMAAPVGPDAAQSAANSLLNHRTQGRTLPASVTMNLAHVQQSATVAGCVDYYVFNASDGGSFAIVAGDDRATAVLGYGNGVLDMNHLPCGLQCMLEQYSQQLSWLAAHPSAVVEPGPQYVPDEGTVLPLLTCNWSQSEPYYNLCPTNASGEHAVTGCIATAMAQVMYYWRYPSTLPAVKGYRYEIFDLEDLPACTLDWDNMLDQYLGEYNEAQATAIAVLMRYCGQACHMHYGIDGSGSYMSNQRDALLHFSYPGGIGSRNRDWYQASEWIRLMREELNAGRPILYTAQTNGGGHAFVIDGWYNGMFHINWGWAGTDNGYFVLDAFNPPGYAFNQDQAMLTGVRAPSGAGGSVVEDFDLQQEGIYYKVDGDEATVVSRDSRYDSYSGEVVIPAQLSVGGQMLTVTAIGDGAFRNCTRLSEVEIPSTIRRIGRQAFRNCSWLKRVTIPEQVATIGEQAFAHCVSLEQVTVPSSVRAVDYDAFEGCLGLQQVDISDAEAWCTIDFANPNANPLYIAGRLLVGNQELSHLTISDAVPVVKKYAFLGCTSLRTLQVAEGVTGIDKSAFFGCSSLSSVSLPSSLTRIGRSAFALCSSLTRLELPRGLQSVGGTAFTGCSSLATVVVPATVTEVGSNAFSDCESLNAVHIDDLSSWCQITFGDEFANPLRLAGHLLVNGETLHSLTIPAGIEVLSPYCMAGNLDLQNVTIAADVIGIAAGSFIKCRNLTRVSLGQGLLSIGNEAFKGCTALQGMTIPNRVETVGDAAFNNCSSLRYFVIGDAVRAVNKEMCDGCNSLDSLVIGKQVSSIGRMAFYSCRAIRSVTCRAASVPQLTGLACFSNDCYKNATLKVPASAVNDYTQADYWKKFQHIVGIRIHDDLPGDVNADGSVNIADVNTLIQKILAGSHDVGCDVNGDGSVNIADVNAVINAILSN